MRYALAALLAACAARQGPPPDPGSAIVVGTMDRSGCFGECPDYTLTVYSNGVVLFERHRDEAGGRDGEPKRGRRLSKGELAELTRAFEKAGFAALGDYERDDCTDFQTVTLEWQGHEVVHYWGDQSAPRRLYDLEAAFDRIVGTRQWLGRDPHEVGPNGTYCGR